MTANEGSATPSTVLRRIAGAAYRAIVPARVRRRIKEHLAEVLDVPTGARRLRNLKRAGFLPRTIIDGGAYVGEWTRLVKDLWPDARVLMIDPQSSLRADLTRLTTELSGVQYASALLGSEELEAVPFREDGSGSSTKVGHFGADRPPHFMPQTTLASLVETTDNGVFSRPDFIKLDVQGAELDVLRGGPSQLAHAECVLLEVSLLDLIKDVPVMADVVAFMAERGFQAYDIMDRHPRPRDGALWQVDILFVRATSPLVESKHYNPDSAHSRLLAH